MAQEGPKMAPGERQESPRGAQDGPRDAQDGPQGDPREVQEGSKTASDRSQRAQRAPRRRMNMLRVPDVFSAKRGESTSGSDVLPEAGSERSAGWETTFRHNIVIMK